jgi:hypothetical protein
MTFDDQCTLDCAGGLTVCPSGPNEPKTIVCGGAPCP